MKKDKLKRMIKDVNRALNTRIDNLRDRVKVAQEDINNDAQRITQLENEMGFLARGVDDMVGDIAELVAGQRVLADDYNKRHPDKDFLAALRSNEMNNSPGDDIQDERFVETIRFTEDQVKRMQEGHHLVMFGYKIQYVGDQA